MNRCITRSVEAFEERENKNGGSVEAVKFPVVDVVNWSKIRPGETGVVWCDG